MAKSNRPKTVVSESDLYLLLDVYSLLKQVDSLENLGYNSHYASTCPKQKDPTGVTAKTYQKHADQLQGRLQRMKKRFRKFLDRVDPLRS